MSGQGESWSHLLDGDEDEDEERYREPALFQHVSLGRERRPGPHPHRGRAHPPLYCDRPRFREPWRGYRCPACGRPVHHEASVFDAHEAADRALATIGRALVAVYELMRDLPRWAEVTVGLVLVVFPVAGWLAAHGWIRGA